MGFLNRLLGRGEQTSGEVAKERLQLVLVHDRVRVSPATLDKMKDELISVISRYVEIEAASVEVSFTQSGNSSRLVADIPVVGPARRAKSGRSAPRRGSGGND